MARDPFGNYVVGVTPDPYTPGNSTSGGGLLHGVGPPDNSLGSNGQGYINDSNGDIYTKSGGVWTLVTGAAGVPQVIKGTVNDPNGTVTPDDPTKGALYYRDSAGNDAVQFWRWSVADQVWKDIQTT